jgi:uncharacterized protein YegP (UPF0339 family)
MNKKGYYQLYRDTQNYWRWRYVASNGRTIAVSSEAYHNRSDCIAAIDIMRGSGGDPIVE